MTSLRLQPGSQSVLAVGQAGGAGLLWGTDSSTLQLHMRWTDKKAKSIPWRSNLGAGQALRQELSLVLAARPAQPILCIHTPTLSHDFAVDQDFCSQHTPWSMHEVARASRS